MTPHLRGQVRAYVDRSLPPALLHLYDKHLVCCTMCRHAADQERRIVAALRSDTGVPMSLRSSLMGLAATPPPMEDPIRSSGPRVPVPPLGFRMPSGPSHDPVPTVRPTAPPLHRSPMRAAVVASIAAGASVAAAWGLAISPLPGARTTTARVPVASFGESGFGGTPIGATTTFPAPSAPSGQTVAGPGLSAGSSRTSGFGGTTGSSGSQGSVTVPYWVVRNRASALVAEVGPVRLSVARSAQSGP
ncbi:MAG TPA: hypothetical protein VFL38_18015 [Humibacillus xanthopallidus]|nr:hypothetical protein [Humibacillus xanthopallidus]